MDNDDFGGSQIADVEVCSQVIFHLQASAEQQMVLKCVPIDSQYGDNNLFSYRRCSVRPSQFCCELSISECAFIFQVGLLTLRRPEARIDPSCLPAVSVFWGGYPGAITHRTSWCGWSSVKRCHSCIFPITLQEGMHHPFS